MKSRNRAYSTEQSGMKKTMPLMPIRLPPSVTAARTQIDGRPTDEPTTWG